MSSYFIEQTVVVFRLCGGSFSENVRHRSKLNTYRVDQVIIRIFFLAFRYTKYLFFFLFSGLVFREAERDLGYALVVSHVSGLPTATSLMMAIQSHILRILLFDVLPTRAYKPK